MQDRLPYLISLILAFFAFGGWWVFGWGPLAITCTAGSGLYLVLGILANVTLPKRPKSKPGPYPSERSLGEVLMFSCFLVFLFSMLRNDFHSASTYYLYYAIPLWLALRFITKP